MQTASSKSHSLRRVRSVKVEVSVYGGNRSSRQHGYLGELTAQRPVDVHKQRTPEPT